MGQRDLQESAHLEVELLGVEPASVRLLLDFAGDAATAAMFEADVFPHSEVISQPYIKYSIFEPSYRTIRNTQTYELAEGNLQLGPSATVQYGQSLRAIGSDHTFERALSTVGWTFPWCHDGYIAPSGAINARFQNDAVVPHDWDTIDNSAGLAVHAVTPQYRWLRVIAQLNLDAVWHDTQNAMFATGSNAGLRAYALNEFRLRGDGTHLGAVIEARTLPLDIWVFRLGGVAFYEAAKLTGDDAGDSVCDHACQTRVYQDVGFGVRSLVPGSSRASCFASTSRFRSSARPEIPRCSVPRSPAISSRASTRTSDMK